YLEKFSKDVHNTELQKTKIIEIIEKQTQLYILPKNLEIKDYFLYIKESPAVKNKVFIYKEKILKEIEVLLPIKIVDIK
ncbi:MAG: hypothetical protein ABL899_01645, partial [Nitrospira sp.]